MVEGDGVEALLEIEVAYAKQDEQAVIKLSVPMGTTLQQAVQLSGLLLRYPEIDPDVLMLGVFGVACKPGQNVKQGDRVEIYRPLLLDPKQSRRLRANKK